MAAAGAPSFLPLKTKIVDEPEAAAVAHLFPPRRHLVDQRVAAARAVQLLPLLHLRPRREPIEITMEAEHPVLPSKLEAGVGRRPRRTTATLLPTSACS